MRRILLIAFFLSYAVVAIGQVPQSSAGGPAHPVGQGASAFYRPASKSNPEHVKLIELRQVDLDRLLGFYNYNRKASPWDFNELQSPLVKRDAIFKFESVEPSEGNSAFVVVIPLLGGEMNVIPLWYRGHGMRDIELDPHNVAIFNALVAREQPMLKTDLDRLNLGVLYLHLFEEQPKILEETNLAAILGKTSPERIKSLLPSVRPEANDGFDVRLFEQVAADGFGEISFSFDRNGMLRSLTKETRTKAELLDSE